MTLLDTGIAVFALAMAALGFWRGLLGILAWFVVVATSPLLAAQISPWVATEFRNVANSFLPPTLVPVALLRQAAFYGATFIAGVLLSIGAGLVVREVRGSMRRFPLFAVIDRGGGALVSPTLALSSLAFLTMTVSSLFGPVVTGPLSQTMWGSVVMPAFLAVRPQALALAALLSGKEIGEVAVAVGPSARDGGVEQQVLTLLNAGRAQAGAAPSLQMDSRLQSLAQLHARDMAERGYASHTDSAGLSVEDRLRGQRFPFAVYGEHIGKGSPTALAAEMLATPAQAANILRADFRRTGIGVSQVLPDGSQYLVIVFTD